MTIRRQEKLEAFRKDGGMSIFEEDLPHPYDECALRADNMLNDVDKKKLLRFGNILRGGIPANMRAEV